MAPKKIKIIDDEPTVNELDDQDFRRRMLEFMQQMDWKLWEMLKIMQSAVLEVDHTDNPTPAESENEADQSEITDGDIEDELRRQYRSIVVNEDDFDGS